MFINLRNIKLNLVIAFLQQLLDRVTVRWRQNLTSLFLLYRSSIEILEFLEELIKEFLNVFHFRYFVLVSLSLRGLLDRSTLASAGMGRA